MEKFWSAKFNRLQYDGGFYETRFVPILPVDEVGTAAALTAFAGTLGYGLAFGSVTPLGSAFFQFQLPMSYKQGSDITPNVIWYRPNTSTGTEAWSLEYAKVVMSGVAQGGSVVSGTSKLATTLSGVRMCERTALTAISGSDLSCGDMIFGKFVRVAIGGSYNANITAIGLEMTYLVDSPGSLNKTSKDFGRS